MATEGPLTGAAERGGQAKYLLWQSYGDIPPEVRLSKVSLTPFPAYFRPMALAPKPEPAGKRTKGRFMSGDAAAAEARIMEGLAREAAGLGVEIVDVAGNIEAVSARVAPQALPFTRLVATARGVNDAHRPHPPP